MERHYTESRMLRRIAVVAIVGLALAALLYKLDGAGQGCSILNGASWLVLEILQPVLGAGWQSVQMYLFDNAGVLTHLPKIVASICSALCFMVG